MEPVIVTAGEPVSMKCRVAGSPEISVAWFKADVKLRKSNTCLIDFADGLATLTLINTTTSDSGNYVCKADNRVGSATSSCDLTVKGDGPFLRLIVLVMTPIVAILQVLGADFGSGFHIS